MKIKNWDVSIKNEIIRNGSINGWVKHKQTGKQKLILTVEVEEMYKTKMKLSDILLEVVGAIKEKEGD